MSAEQIIVYPQGPERITTLVGTHLGGVVTPNMPPSDPVPPLVEPAPAPQGDPPQAPPPPPIDMPPLPAQM